MGSYYYDESCPECDSLNLGLGSEEWNEALQMWQFFVVCRECGTEWHDVREDD